LCMYRERVYVLLAGSERPDIRDLNRHVIPNIPADKWEDLGAELLGGNTAKLSHVKADAQDTCHRLKLLFERWLYRCDASWDVLVSALEKIQLTHLAHTIKTDILSQIAGTTNILIIRF